MRKRNWINRRTLLGSMATLATVPVRAQGSWPARPVRIVVPFAAAGATDTGARVLADGLSRLLGEPVVIENRPGAGGNIGIEAAATSSPDGYTFMMGTQAMITWNPHLYQNLRKDPRRDLAAVVSAFSLDMILVVSSKLGVKTMADVMALAKSRPGTLNYGSAGNGSAAHILMEFVKAEAGISMAHVPYRGTAPALNDLVSGSLDLMIDSLPSALGAIQGGIVVPIAVCGEKRNPRLPAVPTMKEAGLPGSMLFPGLASSRPWAPRRRSSTASRRSRRKRLPFPKIWNGRQKWHWTLTGSPAPTSLGRSLLTKHSGGRSFAMPVLCSDLALDKSADR